ncbi:hypothetical protein LAD12857_15970 [Lacrimispora amygdalina]|uniref:DUF2812 domain-containing protein n=1 Tax=Lacrimispora amygdalina TaxID=253257 RepID=A0ABQ5M4Y7_9FIRM
MNKIKFIRSLFLVLVTCLYAVILSGFSSSEVIASELNTKKSSVNMTPEAYLEQYLEAFNNQDEEAAYRLWIHGDDSEKARKSYADLFSRHLKIWGIKKTYIYTKSGEKYRPAEGKRPAGILYTYEIECPEDTFQVELSIDKNYNGKAGLNYFKLKRQEEPTEKYSTCREFNFAQWVMAFCAILEVIFTLYTSSICIKKKQKRWGLWLLLIMIVYGGVCFTVTENVKVGFFVYTLFMPKIMKYTTGIQVFLSVPVGAFVYWILNHNKRKEIKKDIN